LEIAKRNKSISNFETIRKRKDGTLVEVSVNITPIAMRRGDTPSSSNIHRDISKLKNLERQYQQAQKMEAIGALAGGIAHDFNNVVTIVNAYCGLLLESNTLDDAARKMVGEIHAAGEHATKLTQQLLAFSRQQVLVSRVLDLNAIVIDMQSMLSPLIGEQIIVSLALDPKLHPIKADSGQIGQLLMNLAVNAKDAMPQGGTLTIATHNVSLNDEYCRSHPQATPGEFVLLEIADNGSGMNETTKFSIFEPFFTTKEVGKGTGLGLAMVLGIAEQSGGYIEVDSEVGRGSTFKIFLPKFKEAVDPPCTGVHSQ